MTSNPQRMHPISLLMFVYESIKKMAFPLIVVLFGIGRSLPLVWIVAAIVGLIVLIVALNLLSYLMFTYQILDDEIIIKSGVFVKKVNHVPYDRIQNVTTNQWFFLKPFGLEELEIETAGQSEKAEVALKAVPDSLKKEINQLRNNDTVTVNSDRPQENIYTIAWCDLLKFSLTSPAFFSALLAVVAVYGKIKDVINDDLYQNVTSQMTHLGVLFITVSVLLILAVFYLISTLILISKYYHFQLVERNGQLEMTRGLFQSIKTSISMKRIQAVVIKQPLLRSFLKIATIQLVIVSNSTEGDTEKDIVIMPVIATNRIEKFLKQFLPQVPVTKITSRPLGWTYYYELRNATLWAIPTIGFLVWIAFPNPWLVTGVVILGLFFWYVPAVLVAKRSKVRILNEEFLVLQNNRFMTKEVNYIPKSRIQYMERRSSLWLDHKGLASLLIYVRSGNSQRTFAVSYQDERDVSSVWDWYKA